MGVSAIVVIDDRPSPTGALGEPAHSEQRNSTRNPITCTDILGQSVLDRTVARLGDAGIRTISVIGGPNLRLLPKSPGVEVIVTRNSFARWPRAQQTMREQSTQGIKTVLMIGLGAYMEVNVAEALERHGAQGMPLTQIEISGSPLDFWIVNSRWFSTAATGCTLPFRYGEFPGLPVPSPVSGYVNRLAGAGDLRQLVVDAFLSRCEIKPRGREVRPGIWMDDDARVHKSARLVAPVYVGRSTTVGPSAVITRFSNLECYCQVGAGTVVDSASLLCHTVLGNGLDVSHAVVDGKNFVDLNRNVAFQIEDPKLVRDTTPPNWRSLAHRDDTSPPNREKFFDFGYSQYLSRAAGRLSEVLFKG